MKKIVTVMVIACFAAAMTLTSQTHFYPTLDGNNVFTGNNTLSGNTTMGGTLSVAGTVTVTANPPFTISSATPVANLTLINHAQLFTCGSLGVGGGACSGGGQIINPVITELNMVIPGGGTATATGIPYFLHSMLCVGSDATATNTVRIALTFLAGNSQVQAVGTNGDLINVICTGS